MRAVLLALGLADSEDPLNESRPSPMLPLVDRPFIQHVVEYLAARGVSEFEIVLSNLPEMIERHIGDGSRWGAHIDYHLCSDGPGAFQLLQTLDWAHDETVLLGRGDCLPCISLVEQGTAPVIWTGADGIWTGWAAGAKSMFSDLASVYHCPHRARETAAEKGWAAASVEDAKLLDGRSYAGLLGAQRKVLTGSCEGLLISGHEVEKGVWVSRNVALRPRVVVVSPVFIGENSDIGFGVVLGPNASIGRDCVVDSKTVVADSIVCPGSYVGESLDITEAIVDKGILANVRLGAVIAISDQFILGSLVRSGIRALVRRFASRVSAAIGLLFTWPVMLLTCLILRLFRKGPVIFRRHVIRTPARNTAVDRQRVFTQATFTQSQFIESRPKDILLRFLPQLFNVVRGEMRFVGLQPRSLEEVRQLSPDWRMLYLNSQVGIVSESNLLYGANPSQEEQYSAEAFYSVKANWLYNMRLLFRYLFRWSRRKT